VFHGSFVHALTNRQLEYLHDAALGVDEFGIIAFVEKDIKAEDIASILRSHQWDGAEAEVISLERGSFIIPG